MSLLSNTMNLTAQSTTVQNPSNKNFSVINVLSESSEDTYFYIDFDKSTNGYSVFLDASYFRYAWVPELFMGGADSSANTTYLDIPLPPTPPVTSPPPVDDDNEEEIVIPPVDEEIEPPAEEEPIIPPVPECTWQNDSVQTRTWGDPHFNLKGENIDMYAFDFQGRNDTVYNMIDNEDFGIKALFSDTEDGKARFISEQNTEFKNTDINIVTSGNDFVIYKNNEKIADKSNFGDVKDILEENGIDLDYSDNTLVLSYNGREITQKLNDNYVDNYVSITSADTGLLTQTVGTLDNDENPFDGRIEIDLNNDGVISENEILFYNPDAQVMTKQKTNIGISAPVVTDEKESSEELAENFVELASSKWHAQFIDEAFEGAFEGADEITFSSDSRLEIKQTDSEGVKLAKDAMKAELLFKEQKRCNNNTDIKENAIEAVQEWIEFSTAQILSDLSAPKTDLAQSQTSAFNENSGYSVSQWNELLGSTFAVQDEFLQ